MRHDLTALSRRALGMWIFGGLAVFGIILLSGAMFWIAFTSGVERQTGGSWRTNALEIVEATAEVRSAMRDRHRILHGYALEKSDILLSFYDREKVEKEFADLSARRDLSASQKTRIGSVELELQRYKAEANKLFSFVQNDDDGAIRSWSAAGEADRSLEKIQLLLREIEGEEERLLRAQNGKMVSAAEDSSRYVLILGFLGIAVLGLAGGAIGFVIALSANLRVKEMQSILADEIRTSEERMRVAHEGTGAGTWEYDSTTGQLIWSKELARLYGRDLANGAPTRSEWMEIVHPEDHLACLWIYPHRLFRSDALTTEFRIASEDGYRTVSCRGSAFRSEGGLRRMVGMEIDVTQDNQTKEELSRLYSLLSDETASIRRDRERIFEMTADMMAVGTADGTLLSVNPAWSKVLGYSEDELRHIGFSDLFYDRDEGLWDKVRDDLTNLRPVLDLVAPMTACDGTLRHVSWTIVPEESDALDTRIFAVGRDVTADLLAQDRLKSAESQIHQMRKIESIGQMTGGIAHDFNNLLTPIVGYLDFLQVRYSDDPKASRMINAALQSAERGRVLVSRLLSFARRQHLETKVVDLRELVGGMGELIGRSVGADIAFEIDAAEKIPLVEIDPNQLELALLNLAVNARDAMPDGGMLRVALSVAECDAENDRHGLAPGNYVVIAVEDTGTGMDADQLERAVEPFFSTKAVGKGTGLGLSMAHGLAAQSGGALTLDSIVGIGTVVSIWLPAASVVAKAEKPAARNIVDLKEPQKLRVLVVDDQDLVRQSLADMLTELGHDVVDASSGAEALQLLDGEKSFDLLVTDYSMPSMTGVELIAKARERGLLLGTLVVSGYSDVSERFDIPGVVRLAKPFSLLRLGSAIAEAMGARVMTKVDLAVVA